MSFSQTLGSNQPVSPAASSASVTVNAGDSIVRLVNAGLNICHVRIGQGATTATDADIPILPGTSELIKKPSGYDTVAHISAAGTSLHISTGGVS